MGMDASPEARAAAGLFEGLHGAAADVLWDCGSARELRQRGFGADVAFMAAMDALPVVPARRGDGWIGALAATAPTAPA